MTRVVITASKRMTLKLTPILGSSGRYCPIKNFSRADIGTTSTVMFGLYQFLKLFPTIRHREYVASQPQTEVEKKPPYEN